MNSDTEDPNNHVPEISKDDDWDDVDGTDAKAASSLPPRRRETGIPPKKNLKQSLVRRHESNLKVDKPDESQDEEEEEASPLPLKPKSKKGRATVKKAVSRESKKNGKNPDKKVKLSPEEDELGTPELGIPEDGEGYNSEAFEESDSTEDSGSAEEIFPLEKERILLPAAPVGKRARVHEIGIGEAPKTQHAQIVTKMTPKSSVPTVQPIVGESDTEDIARQRRRFVRGERGDWGEEKGHGSYKWMIYSGVGIVLLIILTVVLSQKFGRKPVRESQKSQFSQMDVFDDTPGEKDADPEMLEMLSTSQTEAKEIYGKYATAKSAEDLTGLLFNESIVMPLLSSRWEPLNARSGWAPGDEATWTVLDREGEHYGVLEGSNDDYTPFYAFFRKDGDSLKLDWKATTGYGSAEFAEMKKAQGDGTEIRNVISQGDFYTFSLPEEKYRSLRMMSPDGNFTLWAYTERESELDEKLIKLFTPSQITGEAQSQIQVILSVVPGPDESLPNQWVIKDLVRMNWLDK